MNVAQFFVIIIVHHLLVEVTEAWIIASSSSSSSSAAAAVPSPPTECVAVTQEDVTWAWPPHSAVLRAWADPDGAPDVPFMQVTLPDASSPAVINVQTNELKLIKAGWVEVKLYVDANVTLSSARNGGTKILLTQPLPPHLHRFHLTASNLTVDCHSGQVVWGVADEWVPVPIALDTQHVSRPFLIYSHQAIRVSFTLLGADDLINISWDAENRCLHATVSSTSGDPSATSPPPPNLDPLPAYTPYLLRLACLEAGSGDEDVECVIREEVDKEGRVLGVLWVPSLPWVIWVKGEGREVFFLRQNTTAGHTPSQHRQNTGTPSLIPIPPSIARPSSSDVSSEDTVPSTTSPKPSLTTPKGGGGGGGGWSGGGQYSDPVVGWSGWWVILTVLLSILLAFVIVMCIVSHYHRPKLEKYFEGLHLLVPDPSIEDMELERPLCNTDQQPNLFRSVSIVNTEDLNAAPAYRLWNAVASGDKVEVEQVMATLSPNPDSNLAGQNTTPYQEAHHRGHTPILRVLEAAMDRRPDVPHNDMILGVMQAHTSKVEAVFESARGGQYRHTGGVDVLLRAYNLPGTIHDHQGRSLLHYAASVQLADGAPLWLAQDVRCLVESHGVLPNAVDFKGCTSLHILVEHAKNYENITCWDGKTLSVCEAWLCLASLLMELGCDPRHLDHKHKLPYQLTTITQNPRLATLLSQAAGDKGKEDTTSSSLDKYTELVQASAQGDETTVRNLLMNGVKVLPLGGRRDPLLEAVRGGHRNTVFLLLSAGAPLCAHGLLGNTPFDAAHRTLGLPALFPALIRKEFCDRLQDELEVLSATDKQHAPTVEGLLRLKSIAEVSGHRLGEQLITWRDNKSSAFGISSDTLTLAASLGLTLTCQLLGVAGVPLHPLPHLPHPLVRALGRGHYHTAYSLCRDLEMNPYSAGADVNTIPEELVDDLIEMELKTIEKKLKKRRIGTTAAEELLDHVQGKHICHTLKQLQSVLYLLAELNLVTLLHQMKEKFELDFNMAVHAASDSTMLHVSSAHGKIAMVEYLLSQVDQRRLTRGGLSSAHLAALRGHVDCVEYLIGSTTLEPQCTWKLTPLQLLQDFNENVKSRHLDLLTQQEALTIMGTGAELSKAQLILKGRCSKLGIVSPASLWHLLEDEECKVRTFVPKELRDSVLCDVKELCQEIQRKDARFRGKVVSYPATRDKMELMLPDNFEFYLELDEYSALDGGSVTLMNGNGVPNGSVARINSTKDQDLFIGENFISTFRSVVQDVLSGTTFTTLTLVPPFLAHTQGGVCIHAALKCPARVVLVRVMVTPVLKVASPHWVNLELLSKDDLVSSTSLTHAHLAFGADGHWVFLLNHLLEWLVLHAETHRWRVLQACIYFTKLLETCWWLPKEVTHDHGMTWRILPVGVSVPQASLLTLYFMRELFGAGSDGWTKEHWFDHLVVVVGKASMHVSGGGGGIKDSFKPNSAMQATHKFLIELLNNEIQIIET